MSFPKTLKSPYAVSIGILFLLHIFFMFYNLEKWAPFGWDQVDNAWAAMHIIAIHKYPLLGMVAKGNSGIYIGPLYYYFISIFYFFTHLDPIAAPIIAGVTSIFSFAVIARIVNKLFGKPVALASLFIYTLSSFVITTERVQWPVNFIAPISLLILYTLYKILTGESKYFLHLGALVGLSFHIHFTAIFYPLISLATLPFVRWNKSTLKYFAGAVGIAAIFFIPQIIYYIQSSHGQSVGSYAASSYHGFHLRRMLQLTPDAFIKFQSLLMTPYPAVKYVSLLFVPLFCFVYLSRHATRNRIALSGLILLWFLIPWIVFTTYSGEISDYYFSLESYVAILVLAYLTIKVWNIKFVAGKIIILAFWIYWTVANIQGFFNFNPGNLPENRATALTASMTARIIPFTEGDPQSYLYYYYMFSERKWLPYRL